MFTIATPKTDQELASYFHFRWQWLKAAWGHPEGAEKDEYETVGEHRVIKTSTGKIVACGRVHLNTSEEAQIRHIAVDKACRRKGVGQMILHALEQVARESGAERAVTNSRESSILFFSANGFIAEKKISTELGKLKRQQMYKNLVDNNVLMLHPNWCKELQSTWREQIPISEHMGIKLHQYTQNTIETRAPLNKNINLHGHGVAESMFAGSIYSLAMLTGWGMLYLQLKQKGMQGEIVLGEAKIQYHKSVTMKPRGICNIESVKAKFELLQKGKKCPASLIVNIYDDNLACAEFSAQYWILPVDTYD